RIRPDKKPMSKQRLSAIVSLAIVGLVCAPRPAHAQSFKVGSFTKSLSGTCPAPCAQTVPHGLPAGVTPAAIIFWTVGKTAVSGTTGSGNYLFSFGFTDGTTNGSIGTTSLDATSTPTDKHYVSPKAIEILTTAGAAAGEAVMQTTAWDATNFYLTW